MSTAKIVGLTGGIGSGKSLVRSLFEQHCVPTLDADSVARAIHQDPTHPVLRRIAAAFPQAVESDGRLRRGSLRDFFAGDARANQHLKDLLTPYVTTAMHAWTAMQKAPYVMWESALLIEQAIAVDRILLIEAPIAARRERVRLRNPDWSAMQIEAVIAMQTDCATRRAQAHDTILNDGPVATLQAQVAAMDRHYRALWT